MSGALAAQVIVDVRVRNVDRVFDYAVPEALAGRLTPGARVLVPFGGRLVSGFVVRYPVESQQQGLKPLQRILDDEPALTAEQLQLAAWMRDRYLCLFTHGLQCFMPPGSGLRSSARAVPLFTHAYRIIDGGAPEEALARAPKQLAAWRFIAAAGGEATAEDLRRAGFSPAIMQALAARGMVEKASRQVRRDPWQGRSWQRTDHALTIAQAQAVYRLQEALEQGCGQFLLYGVTGSGKTLVYLHTIAAALRQGKSAIMLVPEIALTPQAVADFRGWFGNQVAVLHSRMSISERADQWQSAAAGDVKVVLGPRSAVFAPLRSLGLIIIDEEQESAYKQEETPRYHAREVARARLELSGGVLVAGSATPSLESFAAAQSGGMELLTLPHRVDARPLPHVDIVDMREELLVGNRSMFSRQLQVALHECLARNEQAILFLNRRGYAAFVLCRECGATLGCDHCQVTFSYHEPNRLACHYCGESRPLPALCPNCGGKYLRPFGAGTQRVEQEVRRLYPAARVLRMDVDTTSRKGAHEAIWRAFLQREADILVGTQMVAKGLHFPGVTLVGVVSADTSLHFPDFRAAERTFQLLTQVAGRAGRGDNPGRVIVQTYAPEHYAVAAAGTHDYMAFYQREIAFRRRAMYPPFTSLVRLLITADSEEEAARQAGALSAVCARNGITVVGPAPAPLAKLKDRFRWHILLKGEQAAVAAAARAGLEACSHVSGQIVADVDPVSLL